MLTIVQIDISNAMLGFEQREFPCFVVNDANGYISNVFDSLSTVHSFYRDTNMSKEILQANVISFSDYRETLSIHNLTGEQI